MKFSVQRGDPTEVQKSRTSSMQTFIIVFAGWVKSCEDLMSNPVVLTTSSTNHLQIGSTLETPTNQSGTGGCPNALLWELERQCVSRWLNTLVAWGYAAIAVAHIKLKTPSKTLLFKTCQKLSYTIQSCNIDGRNSIIFQQTWKKKSISK